MQTGCHAIRPDIAREIPSASHSIRQRQPKLKWPGVILLHSLTSVTLMGTSRCLEENATLFWEGGLTPDPTPQSEIRESAPHPGVSLPAES